MGFREGLMKLVLKVQDVVELGPGLDQHGAAGVGAETVVGAVGVEVDDQVARRIDVAREAADAATADTRTFP